MQGKRRNVNYKSKKRVQVPDEERIYCYNTHEAIIDAKTYNTVQDLLKNNHSWKKSKHDYLFKGLLFCKECGARLNITYSNYALKKYGEYRYTTICYSYSRLYSDICTRHSNKISDLEDCLLKHIRQVCKAYIDDTFENELLKLASKNTNIRTVESVKQSIKNIEKKINESDTYLSNLYKDKVKGIITEEQFIMMTNEFTNEKQSYINKKESLEKQLSDCNNYEQSQRKIKKIVDDFLSMKKPSKELLSALIEKVTVSENHEIEIFYKFNELNSVNSVSDEVA